MLLRAGTQSVSQRDPYAVALLGNESDDVDAWVEPTSRLLEDVERIIGEDIRR